MTILYNPVYLVSNDRLPNLGVVFRIFRDISRPPFVMIFLGIGIRNSEYVHLANGRYLLMSIYHNHIYIPK